MSKTKEEIARDYADVEIGDKHNGATEDEHFSEMEKKAIAFYLKKQGIHHCAGIDKSWIEIYGEIYNEATQDNTKELSTLQDQLRWRSVEEEPMNDNTILVRLNTSEIGFGRFKKGKFTIESESFGKRVIEWLPMP